MVRMGKFSGSQNKKKLVHIVCSLCSLSLHFYPGMSLKGGAVCSA